MLVITLLLIIICWWLWCIWERMSLGPQPPLCLSSLPIIGNAHHLMFVRDTTKFWEFLKVLMKHSLVHDGVAQLEIGPQRTILITDPEDCLTVSNACLKKPYIYSFINAWLKVGLVTTNSPLWKQDRNLYLSMFNQRNLRMDLLNKYSKILVYNLAAQVGKTKFSPESIFKLHAMEIVSEFLFGLGDQSMHESNEVYHKVVDQILDLAATRLMNPILHIPLLYNFSPLKKRFNESVKIVTDITLRISFSLDGMNTTHWTPLQVGDIHFIELHIALRLRIENRRRERQALKNKENTTNSDKSKPFTYVDLLLDYNDKNKVFTENDMRDHLDTMLGAVFDTSARTMMFAMTLIGSHEDVKERIYSELHHVLGDSDRDLAREDLSKLTYLEAVIKETLRLYPPVPLIARDATTEVRLRNYTIPKGVVHVICVYGMHRHSVWGADAERFRPERWLEPGGVPELASAFASFSLGKRSCIGKHFGLMLLKTSFAHILRRYRVTADISTMVLAMNPLLTPTSGHEIKLELRNA